MNATDSFVIVNSIEELDYVKLVHANNCIPNLRIAPFTPLVWSMNKKILRHLIVFTDAAAKPIAKEYLCNECKNITYALYGIPLIIDDHLWDGSESMMSNDRTIIYFAGEPVVKVRG